MSARAAALHRPRSRSPLEDEDLLSEILLRLPPQPSSLPRASAVCKHWCRLVSDRGFVRRYRRHHRRSPPLLGFFRDDLPYITYTPTMEAPDRVPAGRFSLYLNGSYGSSIFSCRHGLVLIARSSWIQFLVWDLVTGDQHSLAAPLGFNVHRYPMDGAVLRAAGDSHHFQVVLVSFEWKQAAACIYSSETGVWSNFVSTPVQLPPMSYQDMPAVLVADSLHWLLSGTSVILEVDLKRQSLALIQVPLSMLANGHFVDFMTVMRAEGGGLGLLLRKKGFTAQLWKRNAGCDGVASWVLGRTIKPDKLLSLNLEEIEHIRMMAYAEENNVAFLRTVSGIFMVQLESFQFSKLPENNNCAICYPLESVYAASKTMSSNSGYNESMLIFDN